MVFRGEIAIVLTAAVLGCGGTNKPPLLPESNRANASLPQGEAVIVSRSQPVPDATDSSERIIFLREGSVWMMTATGDGLEQLTMASLDAVDEAPQVSPDGKVLAYASAKDGKHRLYLQSMEDMIPYAIGHANGGDSEASWSPDSGQIAFMHGDGSEKRDLYVVASKPDAKPRLLLEGSDDHPTHTGQPVWMPDGQSIILSTDRRSQQGTTLWRTQVNGGAVNGGALKRVTPQGAWWVVDRSADVAPDGERIIFASNRHAASSDDANDFDVYSIALDGSGLTRLTEDLGTVADPVYSPDGKRLFFASTRLRNAGFEWEIYVMAAGGGEQRRLTRDASPQNYAPSVASLPGSSQ